MAMWTCGLCVGFAALLLSQMLAHIRQVHSGDKEFEITCGISNCEKSYKKYDFIGMSKIVITLIWIFQQ